jgi:hypothetical protein
MTSFPLYDSLCKDLSTKDLTVKEKEELINDIKNINHAGKELIYALIQFHNIADCNKESSLQDELPYNGNKTQNENGTSNLNWTLTKLPIDLRHILNRFVKKHIALR